MTRLTASIFIILLALTLSLGCMTQNTALAADSSTTKHFDFKLSVEPASTYEGIVIGKVNFMKVEITNLTDNEYRIGDYFRVLMTQKESEWSQFSMAASGPTKLGAELITYLKYGYGSNSIAQKDEEEPGVVINIGNTNNAIHDTTFKDKVTDFDKWYPAVLPAKGTVTITWPTFWFTDSSDRPQGIAAPELSSNGTSYYCWVDYNNKTREISADSESLLAVISNDSEPAGLRAATVAWLLEADKKNEKHLLTYIQDEKAPKALAFRSMQALMVWGSPDIIDEVFNLWKERKILAYLDENVKYYLTWSGQENAEKYLEIVKSNKR